MLPPSVMARLQTDFGDWCHSGLSIMEVSHRGPEFRAVAADLLARFRRLLQVPANYEILLLPGGAQLQFAGIPMNLAGQGERVDYAITGHWSRLAAKEAQRYADLRVVVDMHDTHCRGIAPVDAWDCSDQAAYCYYTDNETVNGVEFSSIPEGIATDLVCDMSSNILSRPVDVSRFGLLFACSQKNLGPAGLTLVIIRQDLLARAPSPFTPSIMSYALQQEKESMKNTPVTFAWYVVSLVLEWIEAQGGLAAMDALAKQRANLLYDYIDSSDRYENLIDPAVRSRMNVVFTLKDASQQAAFLREADTAGLKFLKGHVAVGGMRASLYNAMPVSGVERLIDFMDAFG